MSKQTLIEIFEKNLNILQVKKSNFVFQKNYKLKDSIDNLKLDRYFKSIPGRAIKDVIILIPSTRLFVRTLDLPLTVKDKIDEIIQYKLLGEISFSDIYFTYHILGKDSKRLRVLVFAAKVDFINRYYNLFEREGFNIKSIIPTPLFLYHLHKVQEHKSEPTVYLDILNRYQNYTYIYKKDIYFRSSPGINNVKVETDKTIAYIKEKFNIKTTPKLIINGEKNNNYNKLHVSEKDFLSIQIDKEINKLFKKKGFLEKMPRKKKKKKNTYYKYILLSIILILLINGMGFTLKFLIKERKIKELSNNISQVEPVVENISNIKEEYDNKIEELENIKLEVIQGQAYLPWLNEMGRVLPSDLIIDQIIIKEDKLVLLAGKAKSAANVLATLERSPYFTKLHFLGSITGEEDGERFQIAGDLVYEIE